MENEKKQDIELVNLTPHPINIFSNGKEIEEIPACKERIPRVREEYTECQEVIWYKGTALIVHKKKLGAVENLPKPHENTYYIVSMPIIRSKPERNDLIAPDDLVRDEDGRIVGCGGFAKYTEGNKISVDVIEEETSKFLEEGEK